MRTITDWFTAVGAIVAAISTVLAVFQLWAMKVQTYLDFEDSLNSEYRAIIVTLPPSAFFDEELSEAEIQKYRGAFYRYFDFCNEQVYLHSKHRVRPDTWDEWTLGMTSNFNRRSFKSAWRYCYKECKDLKSLKARYPIEELDR